MTTNAVSREVLKQELHEFSRTILQAALDRTKDELKTIVAEAAAEAVQRGAKAKAEKEQSAAVPPMHSWMRQKPMRHGEKGGGKHHLGATDDGEISKTLRQSVLIREKVSSERRNMQLGARIENASGAGSDRSMQPYTPLYASNDSAVGPSMSQRLGAAIRRIVVSVAFERLAACLVLVNSIFMGVETTMMNPKVEGRGMYEEAMTSFHFAEVVFCVLFSAELLMRIFTYGSEFLFGEGWQWNVFDAVIVTVQILEQIYSAIYGQAHALSAINVLRLLRLLRIVRLFRVVRLVDDMQRIVSSIANSLPSLAYVMILLAILIYLFSVVFTQMTLMHVAADDPQLEELMHFFGSIPRTSLTLYESIFGGLDWDEPAQLLINCLSPMACLLFTVYIAFCLIALTNVVTGVFVDKALRAAHEAEQEVLCNQVANIFFNEEDPTQQISWEIFEAKLRGDHLADYFKAIDIDSAEARNLFTLLDTDNSGGVDCAELVNGLLRLRGNAGALEVSLMMREMSYMFDRIEGLLRNALYA
eukprot:TRINITY_DN5673_c0_g2_i2.p1 TRINITY_DN5673_c0_g2~~TRINITY_DN5673_c0_g2_i2.p1  ORF type:complete len:551 (+),score=87.02 TRINITY_DN5673_c0_g2_i2:66-1655(+)